MTAATVAARRGHAVTLFEAAPEVGGQLTLARTIPGKEEFHGLTDWFATELDDSGVDLRLNHRAEPKDLDGFDVVIVATGVTPRTPGIQTRGTPHVVTYAELLSGQAVAGDRVAVVGAGGIGFDVATFLTEEGHSPTEDLNQWLTEWGVADPADHRAGLAPEGPRPSPPRRQVTLLQRKPERPGKGLGKTTGWIHRASLKMKGVTMLSGVTYEWIDADGLHITRGDTRDPQTIAADTVVICAGQDSVRTLAKSLTGPEIHVIGGAELAAELDAKRAIDQGARLAARL